MTIPSAVVQAYTTFAEQKKTGELHLLFKEGILQGIKEIKLTRP